MTTLEDNGKPEAEDLLERAKEFLAGTVDIGMRISSATDLAGLTAVASQAQAAALIDIAQSLRGINEKLRSLNTVDEWLLENWRPAR